MKRLFQNMKKRRICRTYGVVNTKIGMLKKRAWKGYLLRKFELLG